MCTPETQGSQRSTNTLKCGPHLVGRAGLNDGHLARVAGALVAVAPAPLARVLVPHDHRPLLLLDALFRSEGLPARGRARRWQGLLPRQRVCRRRQLRNPPNGGGLRVYAGLR